MAVYHPQTRIVDSGEATVAPGAVNLAEGQVLTRLATAQAAGVAPSTGNGTAEIFVGFSHAGTSAAPFLEQYAIMVEEFLVPATGAVTLQRTPVTGQTGVFDITTNAAVSSPAVSGNQVTGLTVGDQVRVTYKFAMTITEAVSKYGNVQPGGFSGDYVGQVGVLKRGTIYTDQIDTSIDWTTAKNLVVGVGGIVTAKASPASTDVLINGYIVAAPSVDYPFLGLEFSAA
jgi:hypothetical protein